MGELRAGEPYAAFRTTVRPEWLDYNGHLNDSAYGVVCTAANEELLEALGLSADYQATRGQAMYTVEAHLRYLAEVGPEAELRAESVVVEADAKRLRIHTTLLDGDGVAVLTGEYLYLHLDQTSGRVVPFPEDRAAAVAAALEAHRGWERPPHLGRGVGAGR